MSDLTPGPPDPFDEPFVELAFLRSDAFESGPQQIMPGDVWQRLAAAIEGEPPLSSQGPLATVIMMPARRRRRWVSGLVAASVAVLALGVVAQTVLTSNPELVVSEPKAGLGVAQADTAQLKMETGVSGTTMPARQVIASGTNYTRATMKDQIGGLLNRIGAVNAQAMNSIVQETPENLIEGATGFTSKMETIRACVTALMGPDDIGTVIIDRATFEQQEVALVLELTSANIMKAWVVGLDCGQIGPAVLLPVQVDFAEQPAP